ncbi:hypothetical protein, partial [Pedobacter petrophilus]|uniref:hypothetical protein n=1 Tax=Pedobacter petrophilus TaxID=1908241 RepID=UPI001ADFF97C
QAQCDNTNLFSGTRFIYKDAESSSAGRLKVRQDDQGILLKDHKFSRTAIVLKKGRGLHHDPENIELRKTI